MAAKKFERQFMLKKLTKINDNIKSAKFLKVDMSNTTSTSST